MLLPSENERRARLFRLSVMACATAVASVCLAAPASAAVTPASPSPTDSPTATAGATASPAPSPSPTATGSPTASPSPYSSATASATATFAPAATTSPSATASPTATANPTATASPSSSPTASPATLPFSFRAQNFVIDTALAPELRAYALSHPVPVTGFGTVDKYGVRVVERNGVLYDHPVAQAQYGMALLESYRLTGDSRYLTLAEAQANRLIYRHVLARGAWYYPYRFTYTGPGGVVRRSPWYSGMAQGQVLDLFTRLAQATGDATYQTAADATFTSLTLAPKQGYPWGVWTINGNLWLEEYPHPTLVSGARVYNGHMFATYGLYSYYAATGNPTAMKLLQGALTTTLENFPSIRRRDYRSVYCVTYPTDAQRYHFVHELELLWNQNMTGDPRFAQRADVFAEDYPRPEAKGTLYFAAGTHKAFAFGPSGEVYASRAVTFTRSSLAPFGARTRIKNRSGIWYAVTSGSFAGYFVQESRGYQFGWGQYATLGYFVPRKATITVDTPSAFRYATDGTRTDAAAGYVVGDTLTVDQRATLNAVEHVRIASGTNTGWWVPVSNVKLD